MPPYSFPQWDTDLFTWINSKHISWLDPLMQILSSPYSWVVLFLVISYLMIRSSRTQGVREVLLVVCVFIANSILSNVLKLLIQRPRPCHEDALRSTIHLLEDCGTHYSFFSAHSSNAFCLAICTALFFKNKYFSILMIIWATTVAYSRIYVGKHYPLDVIIGIIFGITISFLGNYFLERYRK